MFGNGDGLRFVAATELLVDLSFGVDDVVELLEDEGCVFFWVDLHINKIYKQYHKLKSKRIQKTTTKD